MNPPACHPDRKPFSRGLCGRCWTKLRKDSPGLFSGWHHSATEEERQRRLKEAHLASYERNKKARQASTAKWLAKNPDKAEQYQKQKYAHRRSTPEGVEGDRIRNRAWKKRNLTKCSENWQKRRALKVTDCEDCGNRIAEIRLEKSCHWCSAELTSENRNIDHIVPLARGGKHVPGNLVAACRSCNCSKGKKLISEWRPGNSSGERE